MLFASITQPEQPAPQFPNSNFSVPIDGLLLGGLALALGKWLLSREIGRLDESLSSFNKRLDALEKHTSSQAVESVTIERLEKKVGQLDLDVQGLKQSLGSLPKIERKIEMLDEIRASQTTLNQRFENLGFALNQTQEMFHKHQKELMEFRNEVARSYVVKEDDTRYKTILDSKMTALWDRMDRATTTRAKDFSDD